MIRRIGVAGAGLVLAVTVAGCSQEKPGNGIPASPSGISPSTEMSVPSSSPSSPQSLPFGGAPKVLSPLPESVLSGDPCAEALTADQVETAIGVSVQGRPNTTPGIGARCAWANGVGGQVVVGYDTQTHTGLSSVYKNTKPQSPTWREAAPIQGFPAVAHSSDADVVKSGFCQLTVGLADNLRIDVTLTVGDSKRGTADPCDLVPQVADLVVTTLKKKAGS